MKRQLPSSRDFRTGYQDCSSLKKGISDGIFSYLYAYRYRASSRRKELRNDGTCGIALHLLTVLSFAVVHEVILLFPLFKPNQGRKPLHASQSILCLRSINKEDCRMYCSYALTTTVIVVINQAGWTSGLSFSHLVYITDYCKIHSKLAGDVQGNLIVCLTDGTHT